MQLLLKDFGCYTQKAFNFKSNEFTLLSGPNGSGKSMVMKSICFAFYGKCKVVRHGTSSCQVTMSSTINDKPFKIKRISKPRQLKLEFEGIIYENDIAQQIIETKLLNMNWQQFTLSTYIVSNEKTSLVTIPPAERFAAIRQLVSTLNTPKEHLEKLKTYEVSQTQLQSIVQGEISANKGTLERLTKNINSNIQPIEFDQEEFDELSEKLSSLKNKKQKYLEILLKGMTKDKAQEKLDQLDSIPSIEKKIQSLKQNLQYVQQITSVENLKQQFEKNKKSYFKELEKELATLKKSVENEEDQETLLNKAREGEVRKTAREDDNPYWDKSPEEIQQAFEDSKFGQVKTTKQPCPHCSKTVAVDENSKVVCYDKKWDKIETVKHDLSKLLTLQYEWDEEAKNKWQSLVTRNMRIKEIKRLIDGQILSNELLRLKKSFGETSSPPKSYKESYTVEYLQNKIESLTKQLGACPDEGERPFLESIIAIKRFPTQEQIDSLDEKIQECQEEFNKMQQVEKQFRDYQLVKHVKDEIKATRKEIEEKEVKLKQITGILTGIDRLKQLQRDAELSSTSSIVDTLNTYAAEYLEKFFDENLRVELVFKQKSKSMIDLDIERVGQIYRIEEFSQGELIKINLAFILAMNRLQDSKFLFLDEVLQNLDKDILLEIYSCLKSMTDTLSIFVIQHASIEGFFSSNVGFVKEEEK